MTADDDVTAESAAWVAIRRVHDRYADIVTRRAWTELAEIMAPDCTLTLDLIDRTLIHRGPEEIGAFIGPQIEQFAFFQFVNLNVVVDIDVTAATATTRTFMQEIRQGADDGARSDIHGVYVDRLGRNGARWWFTERRYRSFARSNPPGSGPDLTVFDLDV